MRLCLWKGNPGPAPLTLDSQTVRPPNLRRSRLPSILIKKTHKTNRNPASVLDLLTLLYPWLPFALLRKHVKYPRPNSSYSGTPPLQILATRRHPSQRHDDCTACFNCTMTNVEASNIRRLSKLTSPSLAAAGCAQKHQTHRQWVVPAGFHKHRQASQISTALRQRAACVDLQHRSCCGVEKRPPHYRPRPPHCQWFTPQTKP